MAARGSGIAALLAACLIAACAGSRAPSSGDDPRPRMDRALARMVSKGEFDKALRTADSLGASKDPAEREIAAYWKVVTWLYRDEPDSALAILESGQGKWTGGLRRVHAALFLSMAREESVARAASAGRGKHDETVKAGPEKSLQERLESLQKETGDLRAENARLASENEKYQRLLKDLETIR
jgi:hypothetical protein